jgi:hypothetical protein
VSLARVVVVVDPYSVVFCVAAVSAVCVETLVEVATVLLG